MEKGKECVGGKMVVGFLMVVYARLDSKTSVNMKFKIGGRHGQG